MKLQTLHPRQKLNEKRQRTVDAENTLRSLMERHLTKEKHRLALCAERMKGLSPLEKLSQGYSYVCNAQGQNIKKTDPVSYTHLQVFSVFQKGRKNLARLLLITVAAAFFSNFTSIFQNRQTAEAGFYILYRVVIAICLEAYQSMNLYAEEKTGELVQLMQVFCPSFFLAVAFTGKSSSALMFYNTILFLIYLVDVYKRQMVHISKLSKQRVDKVEDVVSIGDVVKVVCLGKDKMGRFSFSMKDVAE